MKIIYFTTAQDEKDYRSFIKKWKISLNASNQNFHHKFIKSLSLLNEVDAISIRPYSRSKTKFNGLKSEEKKIDNINWHYLKRSGGRILRTISIMPQVNKIMKKMEIKDSIILFDTINPSVVRTVEKINEKYHIPAIGICTDSPSNISGTKRSYTLYLLKHTSNCEGYIALTEGLNNLFNPTNKPSYIFEGIVEDRNFEVKEKEKPYIFFGGALLEKYGVYNLIHAFKQLNNPDIDLIICGHHGDKTKIKDEIKGQDNIKFLELLPLNKVLELEQGALCSVNPRPYSEDLDRFSIPSKTLEYMSMGSPVISIKNSILMKRFPKEVMWMESNSESDILKALKKMINLSDEERKIMGEKLKNRALELYSLDSISKNIQPFLIQFIK